MSDMPTFEFVTSGKIYFDSSSEKVARHETKIKVGPPIPVNYQVYEVTLSHKLDITDLPRVPLRDTEKLKEIAKLINWPGLVAGAEIISEFTLREHTIDGTVLPKYKLATQNGGSISLENVSTINDSPAMREPKKYHIPRYGGIQLYESEGPSSSTYLESLFMIHHKEVLSVVEEMNAFWRQSRGL